MEINTELKLPERATNLANLGRLDYWDDEFQEAWDRSNLAIAIIREVEEDKQNQALKAFILRLQGNILCSAKCIFSDLAESGRYLKESILIGQQIGNKPGISEDLAAIARFAARRRMWEDGVRILSAAKTLYEGTGAHLSPRERKEYAIYLKEARPVLGRKSSVAWHEGRTITWEQAVEYALRILCGA